MQINSKKISNLFLCLVPIAIVTGPFLSDLIVTLISLLFLYNVLKEKNWFYFKNIYFYMFLIFYLIISIRSFFAVDPLFSMKSAILYIRFGIFSLATWYLLDQDLNLKKKFTFFLIITTIFVVIDGYVQFFFDKNLLGFQSPDAMGRISGLFGDELILGSYLSKLFFLLSALIYSLKNSFFKKVGYVLLPLTFILILISGDRTPLFLTIITIVFAIFMMEVSEFRKKIIYSSLSLFILASVILFFSEENRIRIVAHTKEGFFSNINCSTSETGVIIDCRYGGKIYLFSESHQQHYEVGLKMFKEHIFFGHGVKSFRKVCDNDKYNIDVGGRDLSGCTTHPHNTYIQILAETGLFGFAFFILPMVFICNLFWKRGILRRKDILTTYQILLISSIFMTYWPLAPSGNLFNNHLSCLAFLPVGFVLQSFLSNKYK